MRERGTIELVAQGFAKGRVFPTDVEFYIQRAEPRYGKEHPVFKVSNSITMGSVPSTVKGAQLDP